ncbi:hypothetical protein TDB9533_00082 [Thalassocella blandensis]|nr:hypothetical protein TDB9533_00082 [Thalassocella blandensis]
MEEHNTQRGMGRGMLYISWILVLIGLTYFFGLREKQEFNPNQNIVSSEADGVREITLKRNKFHHYVASGTINDVGVVFMLDTGATDVAVPQSLARKLNLKKGYKSRVMTANGTVEVYTTSINKLELGPIVLHNVSATINPYMEGNDILLGMSVLKNLEFSQTGDNLTLRQNY